MNFRQAQLKEVGDPDLFIFDRISGLTSRIDTKAEIGTFQKSLPFNDRLSVIFNLIGKSVVNLYTKRWF